MEVKTTAEIYEPGFVQVREWMLYKIRQDHYPMNLVLPFQLDTFDHSIFQETINCLVRRHENFRTTVRVIDGRLKQVVHQPEDHIIGFEYYDLTQMPEPVGQRIYQEKKLVFSALPFNFEYGPLIRIAVFRQKPNVYTVVWVFHHLIIDSHSAGVFEQEAIAIWSHLLQGTTPEELQQTVKYTVYTQFENDLLNTSLGDTHRKYWQEQVGKGLPRLLLIKQDRWEAYYLQHLEKVRQVRRRVAELSFYDDRFLASVVRRYVYNNAGTVHFTYSDITCSRIHLFTKQYSSSLYTLFIAGFLKAMQRLSGQEFFVLDLPVSRRKDGLFKNMIGWLASGGVCYFDLSGIAGSAALISYIDTQLYYLSINCVYPFELFNADAEVPLGSTMPVFLTHTHHSYEAELLPGEAGIFAHEYTGGGCCQDMDVYLTTWENKCCLKLTYNTALLEPAVIEQLVMTQEQCLNELLQDLLSV